MLQTFAVFLQSCNISLLFCHVDMQLVTVLAFYVRGKSSIATIIIITIIIIIIIVIVIIKLYIKFKHVEKTSYSLMRHFLWINFQNDSQDLIFCHWPVYRFCSRNNAAFPRVSDSIRNLGFDTVMK